MRDRRPGHMRGTSLSNHNPQGDDETSNSSSIAHSSSFTAESPMSNSRHLDSWNHFITLANRHQILDGPPVTALTSARVKSPTRTGQGKNLPPPLKNELLDCFPVSFDPLQSPWVRFASRGPEFCVLFFVPSLLPWCWMSVGVFYGVRFFFKIDFHVVCWCRLARRQHLLHGTLLKSRRQNALLMFLLPPWLLFFSLSPLLIVELIYCYFFSGSHTQTHSLCAMIKTQ